MKECYSGCEGSCRYYAFSTRSSIAIRRSKLVRGLRLRYGGVPGSHRERPR